MNKEFVPYQESLELKELGFNEPCFGNWQDMKEETPWFSKSYADNQNQYYGQLCSAPTFSQAFRFFREKYGLKISFTYWNGYNGFITRGAYKYECYVIPENDMSITVRGEKGNVYFNTYEEAELACLKKLIEIVKK